MPNYSLVVNSKFQPFSYQELLAPVARLSEAQERIASEYDALSSKADILEAMGANEQDRSVYGQYKAYSDRLRSEADNLYRNGINTESRQRLSDLRRMYNTDIVPIQNAWQKREQEANLQMKAKMDAASRGVDLFFSRDASSTPLQSYLENPNQTFRTINGQALINEVAAQFKGLANQLQEGKIKKEQLSPIEYNIITQKGMDYNEYMDFINNPNAPKFDNIRGIINNTLSSHGAGDFDPITQQRLFGLASQGVAAGVGARDMQFHTDEYAKDIMNYNQQVALQDRQAQDAINLARLKGELKNGGEDGNMPNIPSVAVGLTPTENYRAENLEVLNSLKAGNDGLKASYFGKKMGDINPLKIYKEYQEEYNKEVGNSPALSRYGMETGWKAGAGVQLTSTNKNIESARKTAREKILKKYAKYGVTDILTDKQYKALEAIGYSVNAPIESYKHSNLLNKLNKTVEQKSRYSTAMTDYSGFNDVVVPRLGLRANYGNDAGTVWEINKEGKLGDQEKVKDLNLYSDKNKDGNKVTDVQYDPEFPGKIVVQLTDGKNRSTVHVMDPSVYDSNLTNMILDAENRGAHPQSITARIYDFLNKKNKVQSKTDSKIE